MASNLEIKGIIPALITPMREDESVNAEALRQLVAAIHV